MGYGYIPRTQPDFVDFPLDWKEAPIQLMHRSIFVGSRDPLELPTLVDHTIDTQERHRG